jgi:DHA1 family multidrug resistance protein-like MFS transporter
MVLIVFVLYFLQGVLHNLGHPVTPQLVEDLGIDNYYFGLYFAAMSLGLLLGGPIWGVLGDRGDKRRYIVLGLLVYSIGQYAFAFVGDENVMILFRFLSGFGVSASITLLLSHLVEHSPTETRTTYLAWYQALFVLGTSLGYYIGGRLPELEWFVRVLETDDLRNIFFLQAVLNVLHAGYIFVLIGPDRKTDHQPTSERRHPFAGFLDIPKLDKGLIVFLVSLALISLGAINVSKYIEVYMNDVGYTTADIGRFVGATGLVSLGATIVVVPLVALLKRDFLVMTLIQLLSGAIVYVVFHSSELLVMLYSVFMVYVVLKAVYAPLEQHYISTFAKEGQYGTILGVRQAFFSVGLVVGPLIGGFLYDVDPLLVFDVSVAMFLTGFVLLVLLGRRIRRKPSAS